ncbi:MAG: hypothetical protein EAZ35_00540 [Sphingobacteriia bacterium]|nr:MAG: hypothetical protein EAZ35_00540 [Sphingobacteriia bacterium]
MYINAISSEETKSVLYYALVCFKDQIESGIHFMQKNDTLCSEAIDFYNQILKEVDTRKSQLSASSPKGGYSLVKHFSS